MIPNPLASTFSTTRASKAAFKPSSVIALAPVRVRLRVPNLGRVGTSLKISKSSASVMAESLKLKFKTKGFFSPLSSSTLF
jgi:hypothetical protein